MQTFVMLGKYSADSVKGMSPKRTQKTEEMVRKMGGTIHSMYALLGAFDILFVLDLPSADDAMRLSVSLSRLTGISFSSYPAISVEKFDELIGE
jgi:uncharacterized protein with GYD domain